MPPGGKARGGKAGKGKKEAKKDLDRNKKEAEKLVDQAMVLADTGDMDSVTQAQALYTEATRLHEANGRAMYGLGLCHQFLGDGDAAAAVWRKCVKMDTSRRGEASLHAMVAMAEALEEGSAEQRELYDAALERVQAGTETVTPGLLHVKIAENVAARCRAEVLDDLALGLALCQEALERYNSIFAHDVPDHSDLALYISQLSLINDVLNGALDWHSLNGGWCTTTKGTLEKMVQIGRETLLPAVRGLGGAVDGEGPEAALVTLECTFRSMVVRVICVTQGSATVDKRELNEIMELLSQATRLDPLDLEPSCVAGDLLLEMIRCGRECPEVSAWGTKAIEILRALEQAEGASKDDKDTAAYNEACVNALLGNPTDCIKALARCRKHGMRTTKILIEDILADTDLKSIPLHDAAAWKAALKSTA